MNTSDAIGIATSTVSDLGDVLAGSLPAVFTLFAVLMGIGLAIYYFRRYLAKRK